MPLFSRKDGDLVHDVAPSRRIMPFLMPTRTESAVAFEQQIDATAGLAFIARWNAAHPDQRISFLHLTAWALAQTIVERPRLNRFTMGYRHYQRRGFFVSFSAKKALDDASPIVVVKQQVDAATPFAELVTQLQGNIRENKSDKPSHIDKELSIFLKLPAPVLAWAVRLVRRLDAWNLLPYFFFKEDPMYASVFIANLGSIKLDAAYHHLFEYGNIPLFLTIGKLHDEVFVRADGTVGTRPNVTFRWTFDERIEDGLYCAQGLELLRKRLEDPAVLESLWTAPRAA